MNFTETKSTVKHEVKSKFRRFADNFCRKNTGFLIDFQFFDEKKRKNTFILPFRHARNDENTIKHMVLRAKSRKFVRFPWKVRWMRQPSPRTPAKRQHVNPLAGVEPRSFTD